MPVLLVRHAQAHPRKDWSGPDKLRPLSPHGARQAEGLLVVAMGLLAPTRVLSSPYTRCIQTVEPLASKFGLEIEAVEELAEGQSSAPVKLFRRLAGQDVVVCTHGDVVAEILVSLADEDRVDLGSNPRQAKGSAWALDGHEGYFTTAKYFAPVVPEGG